MSWLGRQERIAPHADRLLLFAAVAALAALLMLLASFRYGRDQGIYAAVAETIVHGGAPYKDAWDFKPPAIFFVYALARGLFGEGMLAIRLVEATALASLLPAFAALSRRFLGDGRPGLLAAFVAVLCQVQLEYWDTAQPESFGGILVVWALVCATSGMPRAGVRQSRRQRRAWFAAGLLYALAAFCKPPLGGGFLVSLGFAVAAQRREPGRSGWAPVLGFGAGGATGVAALCACFVGMQAWREALEALFVFAPAYHALRFEWGALPLDLLRSVRSSLLGFSAYLPLGIALLLLLPPLAGGERRATLHVALVGALQLLGVALQARFYPYHYAGTLTLWSLLAGWGIWKLWLRVRAFPLGAPAALAALALLAVPAPSIISYGPHSFWQRARMRTELLLGRAGPSLESQLHSTGDVNYEVNRRAATWLAKHTPPDSALYVWGFEPTLYTMARRRPASRYVYNVPQRLAWRHRARARRQLLEDLKSDPPEAIVVVAHDVREGVTGNLRDSRAELDRFPELSHLLERDYAPAWRLEDLTILSRR